MIHSNADLPALLEAFKQHLYTEDASSNTTNAYLSDIGHFITKHWLVSLGSLQVNGWWKMQGRGSILEVEVLLFFRKGCRHVSFSPP